MKCFFQKVKTDKEAIVEEEKEAEATEEKKDEEKVRSESSSLTSPKSSANSYRKMALFVNVVANFPLRNIKEHAVWI